MEFTLLSAALMAVLPVYAVLYWEARRANAAACTRNLWDIALGSVAAGVFAGRLAAMISDGVNPITNPADILIIRGGVATGPAAAVALAAAAWMGRRQLWLVLDGLAAASLAGLAGWHAGCVVRGSCLGTPSDLPWALAQEGSSVTRHPVEVYAALLFLAAAVGLALWRSRRLPPPGTMAGVALAAAGFIRFATEPLRPSLGAGPVVWYLAAVVAGAAAALYSYRRTGDVAVSACE